MWQSGSDHKSWIGSGRFLGAGGIFLPTPIPKSPGGAEGPTHPPPILFEKTRFCNFGPIFKYIAPKLKYIAPKFIHMAPEFKYLTQIQNQ